MNLNQVTVGSTDIPRSEAFYTLLGLRLIVKEDHYLRFECPDGDSTFSVHLMAEAGGAEGIAICFECEDLDAEWARLEAAGVAFDEPPTDRPWLWREALLRDPDGHRLCLFRAGVNRHNPPWRLG